MRATDDDDDVSEGFLSSGSGSSDKDGNKGYKRSKAGRQSGLKASPPLLSPRSTEASASPPVEVGLAVEIDGDGDGLRLLNRSPHPYHHRNTDLLHAADRIASLSPAPRPSSTQPRTRQSPQNNHSSHNSSSTPIPTSTSAMSLSSVASGFFSKDSAPGSDSGTEADDEHFLKGLPAPRSRPHKGLRGMNEVLSGVSTPLRPVFSSGRSDGGGEDGAHTRRRHEGNNVGSDGGESLAGSVFSLLEEETGGLGNATSQRSNHNLRKRHSTGSTAISPQSLFHRLKGELRGDATGSLDSRDKDRRTGRGSSESIRRRREVVRRSTEVLLLVLMAVLVFSKPQVQLIVWHWRLELRAMGAFVTVVLSAYPWWLAGRGPDGVDEDDGYIEYFRRRLVGLWRLRVPVSFDPAPLLYPFALPLLVSFLLASPTLHPAPIINIVLSICTLPRVLFRYGLPSSYVFDQTHWLITLMPMTVAVHNPTDYKVHVLDHIFPRGPSSARAPYVLLESSALLYPLHVSLCDVLRDLTTTSLLPAELQLLSVALINLLVLAHSPQTMILQALLWIGGVGLLVLGGHAVRWGITLARIPRWRFRRIEAGAANNAPSISWIMYLSPTFLLSCAWAEIKSLRRARLEVMYGLGGDRDRSGDSAGESNSPAFAPGNFGGQKRRTRAYSAAAALSTTEKHDSDPDLALNLKTTGTPPSKRTSRGPRVTHTPSGRKKRAASPTVRAFFSLTHEQAKRRKWIYAGYLYACIALLILFGIRPYVAKHALQGRDPFGWALGYLFGDVDWFRLEVVKANLEPWVCLPARTTAEKCQFWGLFDSVTKASRREAAGPCRTCAAGWVEYNRQLWFGAATTRLLLVGYWVVVLVFGLAVVLTLSPVYEVDTRRKVFHFMMVAMLLPATFVDPTYVALALSLVLAVFLLLDMLRASQLPPLSRPIASFLTPYVDGRDLRGPVVISHIFLLIGCAIPLWLSLAALPRVPLTMLIQPPAEGIKCIEGWEVPSRDISMVAGVICVGLGDAAASLIGRRWGRRKWLWGGGKSLEGSFAFAAAVFFGLMLANAWLRIGGWPVKGQEENGWVLDSSRRLLKPRSFAFLRPLAPLVSFFISKLPPVLQRGVAWMLTTATQSVAPRAALCASMASLTEAVLTGGNDNVVVPVILWTCVKSFEL
ncbi:dolichol kinase [Sporothrix bragantina]|uniref:dolichol kinase n=1 Tax=Sporothrix bragantina TaxID=671064 RepID=A0ABP0CJJ9_9PEZI